MRAPPKTLMKEFIGTVEAMLLLGLSHNDTHPGNVARSYQEKVMEFGDHYVTKFLDFGFTTVHMDDNKHPSSYLSKCFLLSNLRCHLWDYLEQANKNLMYDCHLYDVTYYMRRSDYAFG